MLKLFYVVAAVVFLLGVAPVYAQNDAQAMVCNQVNCAQTVKEGMTLPKIAKAAFAEMVKAVLAAGSSNPEHRYKTKSIRQAILNSAEDPKVAGIWRGDARRRPAATDVEAKNLDKKKNPTSGTYYESAN